MKWHALAALCVWALPQLVEAQDVPRDRVTYTTFRPGNWDIYFFDEQGNPATRWTSDPGLEYDPVVSPDGRWLVYCSERRGNPDLFAQDLLHGGEPRLLVESSAMEDQAAFSWDGGTIAFVSTASGNADVYSLRFTPEKTVSISDARNLTRSPSGEFRPAFSPDGRRIAFSSDRDGEVLAIASIIRLRHGDIYVLDLVDSAVTQLTDAPGWDGSPAWSSDGTTIAFYRGEVRTAETWRETRTQIWAMNADGANARVLTPGESNALSPAFLPDGRIAYSRKQGAGRWQLVSVDGEGRDERLESQGADADYWEPGRVGSSRAVVAYGTVPPDPGTANIPGSRSGPNLGAGQFIAGGAPFSRTLPDREIALYGVRYFSATVHPTLDLALLLVPPGPSDAMLARLDGTDRRKLFEFDSEGGSFSSASWSRDGEWIAFTRGRALRADGESDVWKIRAGGSEAQNLTPDMPGNQSFPSFSGDGRELVFRSRHEARFDLYLMSANGGNARRVMADLADAAFPVFSPTARQIAFLSNRDNPGVPLYEVYLLELNADDTQKSLQRLTHNDVQEGHIAYSYDGQWLIFTSEQGGISDEEPLVQSVIFAPQMYGEMHAYRIADGLLIRLTHNKWEEGVPSWEAGIP